MTTVFLSGSRKIHSLNDEIRSRLRNIAHNKFQVVIGDANGADKALQKYLAELEYKNVVIYCSGNNNRNNIGGWKVHHVWVDPGKKGREFYTEKDKKMAEIADYGFVLWDGRSSGSIANVMELLKGNKKSLVYFSPEKQFYSISTIEELKEMLLKCDIESRKDIFKKISLNNSLRELESMKQSVLSF